MVPVLLFFMPVYEAILLAAVVHWFQNLWRLILFKEGFKPKIVLDFAIAGGVAAFIGARLTLDLPSELIVKIIGGFFIVYVIYLFFNPHFKFEYKTPLAIAGGASSGFMAGMFGVGGAFRAAMLSAFDLPKAVFLHTSASIALIVDSTRLATYLSAGVRLTEHLAFGLIAFIVMAYVGTFIGKKLVDKISQKHFRYVVCGFLFLASLRLLFL